MNWDITLIVILAITLIYLVVYYIYYIIVSKNSKTINSKMIGKIGVVKKQIDNSHLYGKVMIGAELWKAKTDDGSVIKEGTKVQVVRVENKVLIVKANIVSQKVNSKVKLASEA